MKAFAALYRALDASTATSAKQAALRAYYASAPHADAAWATYFLAGGKPRQLVPTALLKNWAQQTAALPPWMFDECYQSVGDLAETIALLLPPGDAAADEPLHVWLTQHLLPLRGQPPDVQRQRLTQQVRRLPVDDRLVYFKLITGSWRVGVSRLQVTQALAAVTGLDAKLIAQRLMGYTQAQAQPSAEAFAAVVRPLPVPSSGFDQNPILPPSELQSLLSKGEQEIWRDARPIDTLPYPFFLAHALQTPWEQFHAQLGSPHDWLVEWKWDGIRAQVIQRGGEVAIWTRGEELVTDRYPEVAEAARALPDGTVLDGELVVWRDDAVQPFAEMQRRIGRTTLGAKLLRELPVALLAYDLLEQGGRDLRPMPQVERRARLEALLDGLPDAAPPAVSAPSAHPPALPRHTLRLSPRVHRDTWADLARQREAARALGTEGFMLKRLDSPYGAGRTKAEGLWWKWKIDPMSVDAVLIYAQKGHGRRAGLYSDYTFAVWSHAPGAQASDGQRGDGSTPTLSAEPVLVPFAKAYSGLTDAELAKVNAIIQRTTRESFGPVRSVTPTLVFELGFEGIARSTRHKSGIAVRFPRILRWRTDKPVTEADTLDSLRALLPAGAEADGPTAQPRAKRLAAVTHTPVTPAPVTPTASPDGVV